MTTTTISTGTEQRARRAHNGKRSFLIIPSVILSWSQGYTPISETESLVALGWILRQLSRFKSSVNVFDLMHPGSGCGHRSFPDIPMEENRAFEHLRGLLARLAQPAAHPEFVRFAREMLGFQGIEVALRIPSRKPASEVFAWARCLRGCRLKKSPNKYHTRAFWLQGGVLRLNRSGTRWQLRITYSYRHEDSSWAIGLDQRPGEMLEDFDARAWEWLRDQIKWRHEDTFYHRFCVSADGMKKNELQSCAQTELKMDAMKRDLRKIFAWGHRAPGFWENGIAESLVRDASDQFRELKLIQMTGGRLRTMARWIREDRREAVKRDNQRAAAA